jgi:hypothetical protein
MNNLPFDNNNKARKYQCFVCGEAFVEYDPYKEHVIEKHDEGREYVLCPLKRCGAPVRDVRLHFKTKHIGESVPKTGQMKAMIWKDISPRTGKMKQKKPKFREGYFSSAKNRKEMHYRSGYECEVYECLEALPEVLSYEVEPFKIGYSFMGDTFEYNPDLIVHFTDGHSEVWEIKPANQTHLPKNKAKWVNCQQFCEARGYVFMVMTEIGINKLKNRVTNLENS